MARQTNIKLRGTIGDLIFYRWKGIDCIRAKPEEVKQAPIAIVNSTIFGFASNRAGILRNLLHPVFTVPVKRKIMYALDKVFANWFRTGTLGEVEPIDHLLFFAGFSFNEKTELRQVVHFSIPVQRTKEGQLLLTLPAFDPVLQMKAPAGTAVVHLKIAVAALEIENPSVQQYYQTSLSLPYRPGLLPSQQIGLPVNTGTACLVTVVLAIQYANGQVNIINKEAAWTPAGIIASFYN